MSSCSVTFFVWQNFICHLCQFSFDRESFGMMDIRANNFCFTDNPKYKSFFFIVTVCSERSFLDPLFQTILLFKHNRKQIKKEKLIHFNRTHKPLAACLIVKNISGASQCVSDLRTTSFLYGHFLFYAIISRSINPGKEIKY